MSPDGELDALLAFVRDSRGFDFSGYKRASIARRVGRRMEELGIESLRAYHDLLEADVDEFTNLFNTILINVTSFFRDPAVWSFVAEAVIPKILARRTGDQDIRIWSAGCASGEEPFTLAMLLAEALGLEETVRRVKIYGTDVDVRALAQARRARYPEAALAAVPEAMRTRYFVPDGSEPGFAISPVLRRAVVFGRHDLVVDPPISRIDLLSCRNTLMYFNAETQAMIIPRLHYALHDGGFLLLGPAETVLETKTAPFTTVDIRHRVFVASESSVGDRGSPPNPLVGLVPGDSNRLSEVLRTWEALRDAAFESGVVASLLVDPNGVLVGATESARELFAVTPDQLGRPLHDFRVSFVPVDLRTSVETALSEHTTQDIGVFRHVVPGGPEVMIDIRAVPLLDENGVIGVTLNFVDVTQAYEVRAGFVSTHDALQAAYEELEATNEELQSANEELETTNEELRSSNEQLEPANSELRSAHDDVQRINAMLVHLNEELNGAVARHQRVMDSLPSAVVILDARLLVDEWSRAATELWGLWQDEVRGKPFFALDIGLPLEELQGPVRACLTTGAAPQSVDLAAVNRRGRSFTCRVLVLPAAGAGGEPAALLVMSEQS